MRLPYIALLVAASALADSQGALRLSVGSGYDSNALRTFDGASGEIGQPDLVVSAVGSAEGRYRGPSLQLSGSYDLGLRQFLRVPDANVVSQSASADTSVALGNFMAVGLDALGKDRRGGGRDYSDLFAEAFVEFVPDAAVDFKVHGGAHRFLYWDEIAYSFGAPELGLYARYRFDKRHSVFMLGDLGLRSYQAMARPEDPANPPPPVRRQDQVLSAGAGYSFRGPFTLTVSYGYTEQSSNSWGESLTRHRVSATGGTRLPWKLTFLAQAVWQHAYYGGGVHVSDEFNLTEDEDSFNSVSAKLARPVSEHIDLELRCAYYWGELPNNGLSYSRQLAWLGLTWRR